MAFMHPTAALVLRILLGLLLLFSGIMKIPNLRGFFVTVVKFGILKGTLARIFAYALPFAEVVVGIALVAGVYLGLFSGLALLMLLVSTAGVVFALIKNKRIDDCGCYGAAFKVPVSWKKLVENSVYILVSLYVFVFYVAAI